jgi:hypothetical protein
MYKAYLSDKYIKYNNIKSAPQCAHFLQQLFGLLFSAFAIPELGSLGKNYSIVKDSSADLGVNSKIVKIRPTFKAVSTKISKKNFLHICQYFAYLSIF